MNDNPLHIWDIVYIPEYCKQKEKGNKFRQDIVNSFRQDKGNT